VQANIDCLVGDGVTFGEKSSVKSSVIGDQSIIGDRTKLLNCVIMDHVSIEPGYVNNCYYASRYH